MSEKAEQFSFYFLKESKKIVKGWSIRPICT